VRINYLKSSSCSLKIKELTRRISWNFLAGEQVFITINGGQMEVNMKIFDSCCSNKVRYGVAAFAILMLATIIFSVGSATLVESQPQYRNINQARARIRERMIREQGGRDPEVRFNQDENFSAVSNDETRVQGSGTYYRDRNGRGRSFSYDAIFVIRGGALRTLNYQFDGGGGSGGGGTDYQTITCSSDDGRRRTCSVDTRGGVRLVRQISGSPCDQNRTWGFTRNGIWVDRGCRAEFAIGYDSGGGGIGGGSRPNGRVIYSGPIINRGSNKGLDVVERSVRDGADVQQWEWADQPNQNWDVIDLGGDQVAIINRNSGKALTVQGGRDNNGANIIQRSWNDRPQQRWRLQRVDGDWYAIISVDNGKGLDVAGQSNDNGAHVQQWDYANQNNQKWRLGRP
jgi:hypothetical protein